MTAAAEQEAGLAHQLALFREAISTAPGNAGLWSGMGQLLLHSGQPEAALSAFETALGYQPTLQQALSGRGWAHFLLDRPDDALSAFEVALVSAAGDADLHYGRGLALAQLERFEEAVVAYRQAVDLRPNFMEAWSNLANTLKSARRPQDALAVYQDALKQWPDNPIMLVNKGAVHHELGQLELDRKCCEAALAAAPDLAAARLNLATLDLLEGDVEAGLPGFEWRKRLDQPIGLRLYPQPEWTGEAPVAGKRVLVHAEQGLGDTLQFCRYLPLLADRGAEVVFACQDGLAHLLRTLDPRVQVIGFQAENQSFDLHLPLMSLPLALRGPFPAPPPTLPYLHAQPERVEAWRLHLGDRGFRIGVAWQGSKLGAQLGKSWPLAALAPIAAIPGVRLISLQKGDGADQAGDLERLETLGPEFDAGADAFADSAALIMSLDLVITVDSALAHLAGALGRPVWTLLPQIPDWRWGLSGEGTPWHPTMVLFRQTRRGDWSEPFARIKAQLEALLAQREAR